MFERLERGIFTHSAEETMALAYDLAPLIPQEACIGLTGDLGTGKTTFAKGLGRAWHITDSMTSPSYNLFLLYKGDRTILHVDAYRLTPDMWPSLYVESFLQKPYCLLVEWPQNAPSIALTFNLLFTIDGLRHHIRLLK